MRSSPVARDFAGPLNENLTSDHTFQATQVSFYTKGVDGEQPKAVVSLSGATWNLMNCCKSKEVHGTYKNNPWNVTETPEQYLNRKEAQFAQILSNLRSGNQDFMFLQEVDCMTTPSFLQNQEDKDRYNAQLKQFRNELTAMGYGIVMTQPRTGLKPLATLYKTDTLTPTGNTRGVLENTAFEAEFIYKKDGEETGQRVSLVNMHLHYDKDYSQLLPAYQAEQVQNNRMTIMGGDTNHAPNTQITGLINNWNNATNLQGSDDPMPVVSDEHAPGKKKCYDCFAVNPTQNSWAVVTEQKGEVFTRDKTTGQFRTRVLDPAKEYGEHHQHATAIGKAWERGGFAKAQAEAAASVEAQAGSSLGNKGNTEMMINEHRKNPEFKIFLNKVKRVFDKIQGFLTGVQKQVRANWTPDRQRQDLRQPVRQQQESGAASSAADTSHLRARPGPAQQISPWCQRGAVVVVPVTTHTDNPDMLLNDYREKLKGYCDILRVPYDYATNTPIHQGYVARQQSITSSKESDSIFHAHEALIDPVNRALLDTTRNYYQIFAIDRNKPDDIKNLEKNYNELLKQYRSPEKREMRDCVTAAYDHFKAILADPVLRRNYDKEVDQATSAQRRPEREERVASVAAHRR